MYSTLPCWLDYTLMPSFTPLAPLTSSLVPNRKSKKLSPFGPISSILDEPDSALATTPRVKPPNFTPLEKSCVASTGPELSASGCALLPVSCANAWLTSCVCVVDCELSLFDDEAVGAFPAR